MLAETGGAQGAFCAVIKTFYDLLPAIYLECSANIATTLLPITQGVSWSLPQ